MVLESVSRMPLKLTPRLAKEWMEKYHYKHQRNLSKHNLQQMVRCIEKNAFPETPVIFSTVDGVDNRQLDGNHRNHGVIETGKPIPVVLVQYDAPSELERRQLFMRLDRGKVRSFGDAVTGDDWKAAGYASKTQMVCIGQCCELVQSKWDNAVFNSAPKASHEERIAFAMEWADEAQAFFGAMAGCPNRSRDMLTRKIVMAILLPLFRSDREDMIDLVDRVANSRDLPRNSAALRLHALLQETYAGGSYLSYAKKVAYCVVKHLNGEPLQKLPLKALELASIGFQNGWRLY
jgi:hypothetical protein